MSNEEEKRCPLCAEDMDWTDLHFKPCNCGYQVCVWCWHHIIDMAEKDETEGRCPACRTPYDKEKIVHMQANCERAVSMNIKRKNKPAKTKAKPNEVKKDLTNVRVIQRKMAYVIGLPLSLADEDLLQRKEYFGQYGKVTKVSLSRTANGAIQQFINETCSVYITYSKEEEALWCIQSVHGFVLEGRFLRASFGTAKYCHAWLRNMPCSNPSCLYLHNIGAGEDSFGKDEIAAVHTRSRVQQIVGATHNPQRRSGDVLPPPVDELLNDSNFSIERPISRSILKDAAYATLTSGSHLTSLLLSQDARTPNKTTSFVDVVGRSSISGSEKDGSEDSRVLNLRSELSSLNIDKDNHVKADNADALPHEVTSSSQFADRLLLNEEFKKPFREASNLLLPGRADLTSTGPSVTKEQFSLTLDPRRQVSYGRNIVKEDRLPFDDQILKDSSISHMNALFPSSYPAKISGDPGSHAWQHRDSSSPCDFNADRNTIHSSINEASIQFSNVNSILDDGYNERKFQSSAKSDRIYRNSNSFSNEEIVEHLRRLADDNTASDGNSAFDTVESSIISNILSMDFDACDDSLTLPHSFAGPFVESGRWPGSSWNFNSTKQSGFSYANQEHFECEVTDLDSSFDSTGQISTKSSVFHDSTENQDQYLGRLMSAREPPPGFPACERTGQVIHGTSGSHFVMSSLPINHHRTPSTGNVINAIDVDFDDPAVMAIGRGKLVNELNDSGLEMRSTTYTSHPSTFEDRARLLLLMQQSTSAYQDPKFSEIIMQQDPSTHQEFRYSSHLWDGFSPLDNFYGLSSRIVDRHQSYNPSSSLQLSQQKFGNGRISNDYQTGLKEIEHRKEVSMAELERRERLGLNNYYSGYGDLMFQTPSSGDVYSGLFGL